MSYCRWSSLDHTCDVYAYESKEGFIIHLAASRRIGPQPYVPWMEALTDEVSTDELFKANLIYMDAIRDSALYDTGLPYAGTTVSCVDLEDFYSELVELKRLGYNFPEDVLTTVKEEMNEAKILQMSSLQKS